MQGNNALLRIFRIAILSMATILNGGVCAQVLFHLTGDWNLVGNSSASPMDVASTFGGASKVTSVWKWNKTAGRWAFYAPSMASSELTTYAMHKGYDVLSSIEPKQGFWVNTSSPVVFAGPVDTGAALVPSDLAQGWNLAASADSKTPKELNQVLGCSLYAAGKSITSIWAWDAVGRTWRFYAPALESAGALGSYASQRGYLVFDAALSSADGFWLNVGPAVAGSGICPNAAPTFSGIALVTANDTTTMTAAWLPAQDDSTAPEKITYNIYLSTDPLFIPSAATLNKSVTGQTQTVITGLLPGTTYYLQVVATDMQGLTSEITAPPSPATTFSNPVLLNSTTPLSKAVDLNLVAPAVIGTDLHYPYTGAETPPATGSILVGADTNGNGYLAKVASASISGNEVVVQTTPGTLSEAVAQGQISTSSTLFDTPTTNRATAAASVKVISSQVPVTTSNRIEWDNGLLAFEEKSGANLPAGISVVRSPATGRYSISAVQEGGETNTAKRPLAVTGSSSEALSYDIAVSFTPQVATELQWTTGVTGVTLQKGVLTATGTLALDAKATYNFKAAGSYTKDVTFDVFTRTYTSQYFIGSVPVYQQITFTLGAQLKANATAAINASVNANFSEAVTFGVRYNPAAAAWEAVAPAMSNSSSLTANLSVDGVVTSEIRLIPNVEIKYYMVAAADLSVEPVLLGNIQASTVANANLLTGSFPPGITQLTVFDASLNVQCFVGANLQFLGTKIPLLSKTQVCDIAAARFFSLPTLELSAKTQPDWTSLLTANVADGINDPFNNGSIKWTMYPANAGTIATVAGQPRQSLFTFNPGVSAATVFFSGYGTLGELGRQFAQANVAAVVPAFSISPESPSLAQGTSVQLVATTKDSQGNPLTMPGGIQWSSSGPLVAGVSSTGLVSGLAAGTATITVSDPVSGVSKSTVVTVMPPPPVTTTASITSAKTGAGVAIASGASTAETFPTISGTLSAPLTSSESLRIYAGSALLGAAGVTGTAWTFTPASALALGTYSLAAAVVRTDGVEGARSTVWVLVVQNLTCPDGQVLQNNRCITPLLLGGRITGLTVSGLVLTTGEQTVTPAANATSFTFPTALASGTAYSVTVQAQPTGLTCTVSNGAGSLPVAAPVAVECVASGTVITLAGTGASGFVNGTGATATFNYPWGVAVDSAGNVYVADTSNHAIRKISATGEVSTLAGNGTPGFVDGTGAAASFNVPEGVAVDSAGNVYVADTGNHAIRKISTTGVVATLAGSGTAGFVNGTGSAASFSGPQGVAIDGAGNIYVADNLNHSIRKISASGLVSTLAGNGAVGFANGTGPTASFYKPLGVAVDGAGTVYVADTYNHAVRKISASGVVSTLAGSGIAGFLNGSGTAASFDFPWGVAVDGTGNLYVADSKNNAIRKISSSGVVTTLAGSGTAGFVNGNGTAASFSFPARVAVDSGGNVYVGDSSNHAIRKVTASGVVSTMAGKGTPGFADGSGATASFYRPQALSVDSTGNVYVADTSNNAIRKISVARVISTLAGQGTAGLVNGTGATASFKNPQGVAVDSDGNVYVADSWNYVIRKVSASGVTSTLAGTGTSGFVNGTAATAAFGDPIGIARDGAGSIYVSDFYNHSIRKISASGVVSTLAGNGTAGFANGIGSAASFNHPFGVSVDSAGNVYVADQDNHAIRKISAAGVVSTLAGSGNYGFDNGPAASASFTYPCGIAVDGAGNVYVADSYNHAIRKISASGVVSTLAGSRTAGFANGTGGAASFNSPIGVAVDSAGNVYVADYLNNAIRMVTP